MMQAQVEFAGCSLAWKIEGRGDPVVFIQGVGLHGDGWRPQTEALRAAFQCVTFDNRGMAQSQPAGAKITIPQLAADTLAIMDAAGIASAHLVGHSMGGVIAQQIALDHPARVRTLSLLCTSARGADSTDLSPKLAWLGLRSRIGTRRMRRCAFVEIVMPAAFIAAKSREALAEYLAPIIGHDLADTPSIVMPQLSALKRFDSTGRLASLAAIPTLVLSATHDIIFPPRCGRVLASAIPGARFIEVPDAAHGVPIQCSGLVNEALAAHFAQVPSNV